MGRKNRNASRRSYSSFGELKNANVRFDISNESFKTKLRRRQSTKAAEMFVSVKERSDRKSPFVLFSIDNKIANTMTESFGEYWAYGIVCNNDVERMYFIPNDDGYKMYRTTKGSRYSIKATIDDDEIADYKRYDGEHDLLYDAHNKAYYITTNR